MTAIKAKHANASSKSKSKPAQKAKRANKAIKAKKVKKAKKVVQKKAKKLPPRRNILLGTRSTWINFISTKRAELGANAPKSFGELCKTLSSEWHAMTAEQKQPYVEMYEKDRTRYQNEKANLTDEAKATLRAIRRQCRGRRNANRPKPALSAYMFFVKHERRQLAQANPNLTFEQIGGELGRRWRSLSETERAPFNKLSADDKVRHAADVAAMELEKQKTNSKNK